MPAILSQVEGFVGTITLNHPEKRNALSEHLVDGIIAALEDFKARNVRVVILRALPGSAVWSAGHNVEELPEAGRDPLGWDDPLRNLIRQIENFPGTVIAMIEGTVWGGACETAFACDLIVAAPTTTFAVTPAKLGVPYNVSGMMTFLNAASLRIVKELTFTARALSAERAERLGMINHVVPADALEAFTFELAARHRGVGTPFDRGDEGTVAHPRRGSPHVAAGVRTRPGTAPGRLRQRGLPRGHSRVQGEAEAAIQGQLSKHATPGARVSRTPRAALGLKREIVSAMRLVEIAKSGERARAARLSYGRTP